MISTVIFQLMALTLVKCSQPHIVFIVADDLGWNDVGWHNPNMITPNLDKLAKAGVILNSSYVQPLCSPSRNCFMSGYYPYHTGLQDQVVFVVEPKYLPINFTLIPQRMKSLGYATHIVGKWHLGFCNWKYTPTARGFDSFVGYYSGNEGYYNHTRSEMNMTGVDFRKNKDVDREDKGRYSADVYTERAIEIIKTHDKSKPLYLYLPFQSVHAPLEVPKRFEDMYKNIETINRRIYCGMVTALDEAVGKVVHSLDEEGFMDNLILVFTSDNGGPYFDAANNLPLRGAKSTLWEGGTKGAAFVYSKTLLKKTGYVNTEMMHAVDWYPTLVELAGGENTDPNMDGVSQYDMLINGGKSKRNGFVYNIYDMTNSSAIRYGDLKLIQGSPGNYNNWAPLPKLGMDMSVYETDDRPFPPYMMFNITADPTEHVDIITRYPELAAVMIEKLDEYKKSRVPALDPAPDPASNPKYFSGAWSPGWC